MKAMVLDLEKVELNVKIILGPMIIILGPMMIF